MKRSTLWHNLDRESLSLIETMPGGLAVFDYDGDSRPDVFFTNGAEVPSLVKSGARHSNRLYRNLGDLRFSDVTEAAGLRGEGYAMAAAVGDYDNDGDPDLYIGGVHRQQLLRNSGGHFEDVTAGAGLASDAWVVGAGFFDYDNDGLLDLVTVNYTVWTAELDRFCGDQARGIRVYCHPKYFEPVPLSLYRNRGDGRFEDVSVASGIAHHRGRGMGVAFADYDRDGFVDFYVTNDKLPGFLFRNRGDGTFEETALASGTALPEHGQDISGMGVDFRDYDNDAWPDVHVTALAGESFPLYRNLGQGLFQDVTYRSRLAAAVASRSGWANALVDLDNDGWKDLFTANSHVNDAIDRFESRGYREANSVFRNLGDGTFEDLWLRPACRGCAPRPPRRGVRRPRHRRPGGRGGERARRAGRAVAQRVPGRPLARAAARRDEEQPRRDRGCREAAGRIRPRLAGAVEPRHQRLRLRLGERRPAALRHRPGEDDRPRGDPLAERHAAGARERDGRPGADGPRARRRHGKRTGRSASWRPGPFSSPTGSRPAGPSRAGLA